MSYLFRICILQKGTLLIFFLNLFACFACPMMSQQLCYNISGTSATRMEDLEDGNEVWVPHSELQFNLKRNTSKVVNHIKNSRFIAWEQHIMYLIWSCKKLQKIPGYLISPNPYRETNLLSFVFEILNNT